VASGWSVFELLLQHRDNGIIPGEVQIIFRRRDVHLLACQAAIGVRRRVQRLMNVAYEMDQKGEVAGRASFVVIFIAKPLDVLVDLAVTQFPSGHRAGKSVSLS
jgi:hypothetical protein